MPAKAKRSFRRHFIKAFLVCVSIFIIGFGALYIWFVHNSKGLLIDYVNRRSSGMLRLELAEVTFDFLHNEVKIDKAKILSTKKDNLNITYQVSFGKITLHTNSIWSLLVKRSLEIRQIKAYDPVIEVYNSHRGGQAEAINTLSIGMELGKIYNSIQDIISALHMHSIYIINATLILNNKAVTGQKRIVFSNIYFTLKKLHKYNKASGGYVENNTIDFNSSNQAITFSDGIHQLLFKKLSIKQARTIILDSCTLIALPVHSFGSKYTINFKKLALVGVDFHALYRKNLIKADSVYCEKPMADIRIIARVADSNIAVKGLPDLEKIIKIFSGNLDLGFVGVTNADIHLDIKGKRSMSNIHSGKANFQIKNLRIDPDSSQLISMSNFDMMVKGYQLYNSDSTCVYSFDSIRFGNDKLVLNNVSIHTISGNNRIRNYRDYTMPYFELSGINWAELVFRQNLKATEAIMFSPTINFIKNKTFEVSKRSILSHRTFDDFMDIEKFKIINGAINIRWGINNSLELLGLNLGISGDNITDYKHLRLNEDIESLFFTNGLLKIGDINAQLQNVIFKANNEVRAGELIIENKKKGIDARINDVSIKNIYSERKDGNFVVNGMKWTDGTINLNTVGGTRGRSRPGSILLKNIAGRQTHFQISKNNVEVNAFVKDVQIASLYKDNDLPIAVNGLHLSGEAMNLSNPFIKMTAGGFILSDNSQQLTDAIIKGTDSTQRLSISIPFLQVTGDVNNLLTKNFHFTNITLQSPVIDFQKLVTPQQPVKSSRENPPIPTIAIDRIDIYKPFFDLQMQDTSGARVLLPSSPAGEIKIDSVRIGAQGAMVGSIELQNGAAQISKGKDRILTVDSSITLNLEHVNIPASANNPWGAWLSKLNLKNTTGFVFNLKENTVVLKDINAGNLSVTPSSVKNIGGLLDANPSAWVSTSSAKYLTKKSLFQTNNFLYNANTKTVTADSIMYHPFLSRDSTIASNPYQVDYIFFTTGRAVFDGLDLAKTFSDNSISIQRAVFNHAYVDVYRDKLPPFLEGTRKQLFTEMIKDISLPVSINTLNFNEGKVSYIEKNDKSRLEGNVILAHLNGTIGNLQNKQLQTKDSLSLSFTGKLLDEISFDLQLHQSYLDPLYGFVMNLKMQPASLMVLNPMLIPLSDVRFVSGKLDKLEMRVSGNENATHGSMKFYYHNLRIQLLKNGGIGKRKILMGAESGLLNFFFLRNNNTSRTGLVYFERVKDRSFFNYMNKIIFSGVSTSVGARKNNKYKKLSRKNNLSVFE